MLERGYGMATAYCGDGVENAGEGVDTVQAFVNYTLTANIENLTLMGGANLNGTGNELSNRIMGNSGATEINGMAGNDTLTGGGGSDTFAFSKGFGNDIVTDFSATSDFLKFTGVDKSAMTLVQSGSSVVIGFGGVDSITLLNTKLTDPSLTNHFQFF
jgi:Ca2+-binding RTX toxin-like protein